MFAILMGNTGSYKLDIRLDLRMTSQTENGDLRCEGSFSRG